MSPRCKILVTILGIIPPLALTLGQFTPIYDLLGTSNVVHNTLVAEYFLLVSFGIFTHANRNGTFKLSCPLTKQCSFVPGTNCKYWLILLPTIWIVAELIFSLQRLTPSFIFSFLILFVVMPRAFVTMVEISRTQMHRREWIIRILLLIPALIAVGFLTNQTPDDTTGTVQQTVAFGMVFGYYILMSYWSLHKRLPHIVPEQN